jgi:hypothetical protein
LFQWSHGGTTELSILEVLPFEISLSITCSRKTVGLVGS